MTRSPSVRTRYRFKRALMATTIVAFTWSLTEPAAGAAVGKPVDSGEVVVVDVQGRSLTHGRSATEFTLHLPQDAACPGDSAIDQWRVQSFIVPATEDPGTLKYGVIGPEGNAQFALYELNTRPFVNILTRPNVGPGEPGMISLIPTLGFAVFPPGTLPDGRYRIGIACTYFRETAKFWDTEIVITASPNDNPGHLLWRLENVPENVGQSDKGSGQWVILAAGGFGAAALGWFIWRLWAQRITTLSKEQI